MAGGPFTPSLLFNEKVVAFGRAKIYYLSVFQQQIVK
jgi:hypothetical protein